VTTAGDGSYALFCTIRTLERRAGAASPVAKLLAGEPSLCLCCLILLALSPVRQPDGIAPLRSLSAQRLQRCGRSAL